jgi:hypothetical protein
MAAAGFVFPDDEFDQRHVSLGPLAAFPAGEATFLVADDGTRLQIVRLDDGEVRVFEAESTYLGCTVPWRPEFQWNGEYGLFRDPCHGGTWMLDGTAVTGRAPRDLDQYEAWQDDENLMVNLDHMIRGRPSAFDVPPLPDLGRR